MNVQWWMNGEWAVNDAEVGWWAVAVGMKQCAPEANQRSIQICIATKITQIK